MNNFLYFMRESVSNYHACLNIEKILKDNNYVKLEENNYWKLEYNKKYYLKRNDTAIIAFTTPKGKTLKGSNIIASHLDSPTFKIKPNNLINDGHYIRLNTEVYGGPILASWFDKPLSIAGKVLIKEIDVDKGILKVSHKETKEDPYKIARKNYVEKGEYLGEITGYSDNGVFVNLEQGIDTMATLPNWMEMPPTIGDKVVIKIIKIQEEKRKIYSSLLKVVRRETFE